MLLKRYFYLLIPLFFLGLASCTIPVTVNIAPRSSIQQSKDIQSANIPYSVEIIFNEDEVKSYRDYRFGSHDITYKFYIGKYLKDAIKYYVYPHFDQNSNENIILKIETFDIKGYEPEEEGGFFYQEKCCRCNFENNNLLRQYSSLFHLHRRTF